MTPLQTLTLVFEFKDPDAFVAFERDHPNIKALALASYDPDAPYKVCGMSRGNEVHRHTLIEEALERGRGRFACPANTVADIERIVGLYEPHEFAAYETTLPTTVEDATE